MRTRKRALNETISKLQSVIGFNEEMLEEDGFGADHALNGDGSASSDGDGVTDQLIAEDTTMCWTCGSEVKRHFIEETLEQLRSRRLEKFSERNEITQEIEELEATRKERQQAAQQRERAQHRLEQVETELDQSRQRVEDLESKKEELESAIDELEDETQDFDDTDYSEALDLHREANRLEVEVDRLESDVEDLDDRIAEIEDELEKREELKEQRESVQEELTDLRTRVDRIEEEAVEEFNHHNLIDSGHPGIREYRSDMDRTAWSGSARRATKGYTINVRSAYCPLGGWISVPRHRGSSLGIRA